MIDENQMITKDQETGIDYFDPKKHLQQLLKDPDFANRKVAVKFDRCVYLNGQRKQHKHKREQPYLITVADYIKVRNLCELVETNEYDLLWDPDDTGNNQRDEYIESLNRVIDQLHQDIVELHQEIADKGQQIEQLNKQNQSLKMQNGKLKKRLEK